jgi:hypothetical protein
MRLSDYAVLLATSLLMSSCLNEDSTLAGPGAPDLEPGDEPAMSGSRAGEARIMEPRNGAQVTASVTFAVLVRQELRGGPVQGRGQLQYSSNEEQWINLGAAFPWSKQDWEFEIPDVTLEETGQLWLRMIVYERSPERPFLESLHASIRCRDSASLKVARLD